MKKASFVVLILVLSISKGWFVLIVFPLAVITLPLMLVVNTRALRSGDRRAAVLAKVNYWSYLALYILLPGQGDGDEVLVFAIFYTEEGTLSDSLYVAATASAVVALVSFVSLVALRVSQALRTDSEGHPSATT